MNRAPQDDDEKLPAVDDFDGAGYEDVDRFFQSSSDNGDAAWVKVTEMLFSGEQAAFRKLGDDDDDDKDVALASAPADDKKATRKTPRGIGDHRDDDDDDDQDPFADIASTLQESNAADNTNAARESTELCALFSNFLIDPMARPSPSRIGLLKQAMAAEKAGGAQSARATLKSAMVVSTPRVDAVMMDVEETPGVFAVIHDTPMDAVAFVDAIKRSKQFNVDACRFDAELSRVVVVCAEAKIEEHAPSDPTTQTSGTVRRKRAHCQADPVGDALSSNACTQTVSASMPMLKGMGLIAVDFAADASFATNALAPLVAELNRGMAHTGAAFSGIGVNSPYVLCLARGFKRVGFQDVLRMQKTIGEYGFSVTESITTIQTGQNAHIMLAIPISNIAARASNVQRQTQANEQQKQQKQQPQDPQHSHAGADSDVHIQVA